LTYIESDADGRVFMGNAFSPDLVLRSGNNNTIFRLRETHAPAGYRTPGGHWDVTISYQAGNLPVFTAQGGNPAFFPNITVTSGPLTGIRQVVGNTPFRFDFWKTEHNGSRLSGAEFRLFVWNGTGTPTPGLITNDMIGPGANQWSEVSAATSSLTVAMVFHMRPDRYYQLVETVPPPGFQMPAGQWRITVNNTVPSTLSILPVSGLSMPGIEPCTNPETYNIHNWPEFSLPLTGGGGIWAFMASAMAVITMAMCGIAIAVYKRRRRVA